MAFSNEEKHEDTWPIFTDDKFKPLRDALGLTQLRELGNQLFSPERHAADNIIVTCDITDPAHGRSEAHQVSACVCAHASLR